MKKLMTIKIKNKMLYDTGFNMMLARMSNDFIEEIADGTAELDWVDWTDKDKAKITILIEGDSEEMKKLLKTSLRERFAMRTIKPFIEIIVEDA